MARPMQDTRTTLGAPMPAEPGAVGAVPVGRGGTGRRRRGAWLLLALLALLAVITLIVALASSGDKDTKAAAPSGAAAPAAGAPAHGALVGGGGVAPTAASGALAPAGVIGDVLFAESGTELDASAQQVIANAASQIRASGAKHVAVIGYTDTNGNAGSNVTLSQQRAQVVEAALQQQLAGVPVSFSAAAQGQNQPVAPNDTPQGQQLNRRVAITTAS